MYFKQNRPSNKFASDSSTTNKFTPRPFKVEDSPSQDIVQAKNLDTQPQKSQSEPTYRHLPVFAPNQVQPQPFSSRLQLKIDPISFLFIDWLNLNRDVFAAYQASLGFI
ncbi:transposase (plasmid) [Nostoc sp. HK-01]|nr:transposase [Nostoc sp. HK-01]